MQTNFPAKRFTPLYKKITRLCIKNKIIVNSNKMVVRCLEADLCPHKVGASPFSRHRRRHTWIFKFYWTHFALLSVLTFYLFTIALNKHLFAWNVYKNRPYSGRRKEVNHHVLLLSWLFKPLLGPTRSRGRCWAAIRLSHRPKPSSQAVHGEVDGLDIGG